MQVVCNRATEAHPFGFVASSMEAQAHTSCNRRAGYYVQETAPPLAPIPRLLDCGTSAATRGNPAHGPTVPIEHSEEAAVKSPAGSRPLLKQQGSLLPRREDDAPVFRSSNDTHTRPPRESPVPSH
jgi:hypothetical protein